MKKLCGISKVWVSDLFQDSLHRSIQPFLCLRFYYSQKMRHFCFSAGLVKLALQNLGYSSENSSDDDEETAGSGACAESGTVWICP